MSRLTPAAHAAINDLLDRGEKEAARGRYPRKAVDLALEERRAGQVDGRQGEPRPERPQHVTRIPGERL